MERFPKKETLSLPQMRSSSDETERRMIINLLVEEMDNFKMSIKEDQQDKLGKSSADRKH
jgi:hypothetical protein